MEMNLTDAQKAEIAALRAMAEAKYEIDGGEMCECFNGQDYLEAIVKHGTAEAAWAMHMRSIEAGREACCWHEAQAELKAVEMTPEEAAEVAMHFPTNAQRGESKQHWPELPSLPAGFMPANVPESATHCEFGQMEYDWHLCQAGM